MRACLSRRGASGCRVEHAVVWGLFGAGAGALYASEIVSLYAADDAHRRRNEPCTCGSGRKWKHCHSADALQP